MPPSYILATLWQATEIPTASRIAYADSAELAMVYAWIPRLPAQSSIWQHI